MHPQFVELFPFALAGIILGTFIPFENDPPPTRDIPLSFIDAGDEANASPPPGVVSNDRSGLHGLLIRCLASLLDALGEIYALSTTLHRGDSRFSPASADSADARTKFRAAAHARGWAGLAGASNDGLTLLGALRSPNNLVTQDEVPYVHQFISYTVLDILSRHDNVISSPGVLNDIARRFARTGLIPPIPSITTPLQLDAEDINFVVRSILAIATLVIRLISRVENEPAVRATFTYFAENPTSWIRFTHSATAAIPSVQEIVQVTHRPHFHPGSSRILTIGPSLFSSRGEGKPSTSSDLIVAGFNNRTFDYEAPLVGDIEAGTGSVTLRDEEVEYLAALFVAALMRFHARGTTSVMTSRHAN